MIKTITLLSILCTTQITYSQEKKSLETLGKPKKVSSQTQVSTATSASNQGTTYSISKNGEQVEHNKAYYEQQLVAVENHIQAIDVKVEFVKNDEQEHQLAIESGWYQRMEAAKKRLHEQKNELSTKIKTL